MNGYTIGEDKSLKEKLSPIHYERLSEIRIYFLAGQMLSLKNNPIFKVLYRPLMPTARSFKQMMTNMYLYLWVGGTCCK